MSPFYRKRKGGTKREIAIGNRFLASRQPTKPITLPDRMRRDGRAGARFLVHANKAASRRTRKHRPGCPLVLICNRLLHYGPGELPKGARRKTLPRPGLPH